MGALGVIPARYASTRFPGKSLAEICGKPLICWVVENALRADRLDEVIVATDDERIAEAVKGLDTRAVMTREDHESGTDRIAEAIAGSDADVVVNIQGDEPLIDPGLIDSLAGVLQDSSDCDMATAAAVITDAKMVDLPQVVKVVCDGNRKALYFSRSVIPHVRDGSVEDNLALYRRHIGVYAYRREFLMRMVAEPPCELEKAEKLEQLRALHVGGRIAVLDTEESGIGVDTPEDAAIVERELKKRMG